MPSEDVALTIVCVSSVSTSSTLAITSIVNASFWFVAAVKSASVGASLTAVTVTTSVPVAVAPLPSETV